jgi:hypothetical protein
MARHQLVVIGVLGDQTAYLDVPVAEAEQRYRDANAGVLDSVGILEFDDKFDCYEVFHVDWKPCPQ